MGDIHCSEGVNAQLRAELRVGQDGKVRGGRLDEPADGQAQRLRADEHGALAQLLGLLGEPGGLDRQPLGVARVEQEERAGVAGPQRLEQASAP